jgi:hypothetical protein
MAGEKYAKLSEKVEQGQQQTVQTIVQAGTANPKSISPPAMILSANIERN